ncbi:hypothetical protein DL769_004042 [Monosporascus sp. CRB-8-3]|nr:hypothetical protein DL769_004042 [Monosporascus sp. CRB-8-3]
MSFSALWQQSFPPAPTFTEEHIIPSSQVGKVFIITGTNSGLSLALVKLLYLTGATTYLTGRSGRKLQNATNEVTSILSESASTTPAILKSLHLDLPDLMTVESGAASLAA